MDTSDAEQTTLDGTVGRPPDEVRRLYENGDGISQLAETFDCSTTAIIDDLLDLGLVEPDAMYPDELPQFVTPDEYEVIQYGPHRVRVHRLLMVAEDGFEAVANASDIHHESFPWDNRPDALVVCATPEEHQGLHHDRLDGDHDDQQQLSRFRDRDNHSLDEFIHTERTTRSVSMD